MRETTFRETRSEIGIAVVACASYHGIFLGKGEHFNICFINKDSTSLADISAPQKWKYTRTRIYFSNCQRPSTLTGV